MRTWTTSACRVLTCSLALAGLVAASVHSSPADPAQVSARTGHSSTARQTKVTLTRTLSSAVPVTAASSPARYVVQRGDTLSGIAVRFAVHGGWPALYAANRPLIGPDPNVIGAGTVLVLPGVMAPVRYRVAAGDTLAAIATGLGVRGGWPALYAANRPLIGANPDTIRPGSVLTVPRPAAPPAPAAPAAPASGAPRQQPQPGTALSGPVSPGGHSRPATAPAPPRAGIPMWLTILLLAVGLAILAAFLADPIRARRRGRQQAALARAVQVRRVETGQGPGSGQPYHIILADHERVVVTRSPHDDTICVLRPPGEDPRAILRVARLVLPEGPYAELARQLRVAAGWPMK